MVVAKGDTILVTESSLPGHTIEVQWTQALRSKTEKYTATQYKIQNKAGESEADGALFIQTSYLQQFKDKAAGNKEKFTITVDDSFQYGQKQGGTGRWLVYHDKAHKPFQHRFVCGLVKTLGEAALTLAGFLGYGKVAGLAKQLEGFVGDPLRNF